MSASKIARSRVLRNIPVDQVDFTAYNPEVRRADVDKLRKSIGEVGQLTPIQVVEFPDTGRFQIGDGNRTTQAILELGLDVVQAMVYIPNEGESPQELVDLLFEELNKTKRTLKNGEMLNAALAGGPSFNGTVKSNKDYLELHFSTDEVEMLRRKGVTPTVVAIAKRATKYCLKGEKVGADTNTFHNRVRRTILWLINEKTQQDCALYIRRAYDRERLKDAIDAGKQVPLIGKGKKKSNKD